jgi:hypothetical protein
MTEIDRNELLQQFIAVNFGHRLVPSRRNHPDSPRVPGSEGRSSIAPSMDTFFHIPPLPCSFRPTTRPSSHEPMRCAGQAGVLTGHSFSLTKTLLAMLCERIVDAVKPAIRRFKRRKF